MLPQRTTVLDSFRAGELLPPKGQDEGPLPSLSPCHLQTWTDSGKRGGNAGHLR